MGLNNPHHKTPVKETILDKDIVAFVKVSKTIKKNGVDVTVKQRQPVTRDKYFASQLTSDVYDLQEQLSAGVDLKEVSMNLNSIDPAIRERIYAQAGAKLFNELSHINQKETAEPSSSASDQNTTENVSE